MNLLRLGANIAFLLRGYGIHIQPEHGSLPKNSLKDKKQFLKTARHIYDRHLQQSREAVDALRKKYETPVYGPVRIWDMLNLLGQCIDPSDPDLYCVSQLVHTLQVVDAMEQDGICDEDLLIAALLHDVGKVVLLTEEAPENVVCRSTPCGTLEKGVGLDRCTFHWNHEEFIYHRLKDYVPEHISWLLRYHGIDIGMSENSMSDRDREYTERYLRIFQKYDKTTKSIYKLPRKNLTAYRNLIEHYFPKPLLF